MFIGLELSKRVLGQYVYRAGTYTLIYFSVMYNLEDLWPYF